MNILIKLTCLIGLVIAPILGNGTAPEGKEMKCVIKMESSCSEENMMGKCDMSKCATMTKDECAAMCDSLKCSPEEKEMCLSHYDENGKFVAPKECKEGEGKSCCVKKEEKNVKVILVNDKGNAKATVITTEKGKATTQVFEGSIDEVKAKVESMK